MLEDFRLRVFTAVAEYGSFTESAHKLGISQPAVSQNIAELERLAGEALLVRSRGNIALTDKGKLLLEYARKILYWYDRANAVVIDGTEKAPEPSIISLAPGKDIALTVLDGELTVKIL
ncbi:MAG: LysR family transcriptional regulator [Bacteroidales bacterium]|nr:LysR family transcriptional regulator [Candidatus Cryptobacteroides choladohippi]